MVRIERILTPRLQQKYLAELADTAGAINRQPSDRLAGVDALRVQSCDGVDANEFLLYHGAPSEIIQQLRLSGLDPRKAGEHFGTMFGRIGTYLATNSSKSDIYTKPNAAGERCVLVVRTVLGEPHKTKVSMPTVNKPPDRPDGRGALNSVVALTQAEGGCVEHPEFIVYQGPQTLPECAPAAAAAAAVLREARLPVHTHA